MVSCTALDALCGCDCPKDGSGVLYFSGERIAEILKGLDSPQYSDDVLVGAETPRELFQKAVVVYRRFNDFGVKVNYAKVKWLTTKMTFLGYEIENGHLNLREYIKKKKESLGNV